MLKTTFAAFAALFLIAGVAVAQGPRPAPVEVRLRGKVFVGNGQANVDRIEVRLERVSMQPVATTYTDGVGNFEFRNLSGGGYYIVVRLDGYDEVRQPVDMTMAARGGAALVTISLNKTAFSSVPSRDGDHIVDIMELQRNYPKRAMQEFERGVEDNKKGNTLRAIERMEEVIKLAPDFYQAHNNLGVYYQKMDRFADAAREYQIARELNPRVSEPLVNLGSLYIQESDARKPEGRVVVGRILDDALDILDEAVKMSPQSSAGYYYLGAAYYKSDFLEEAEQNLLRAQSLEPKSRPARLMLINVYMKAGKWEDVLTQLNAYLAENPNASDHAQIEIMRSKVLEGLEAK